MKAMERVSHLLPAGYRIRYRFFWGPVRVAGQYRFLESVPIVQRLIGDDGDAAFDHNWHDVGFLDELEAGEAWDGETA